MKRISVTLFALLLLYQIAYSQEIVKSFFWEVDDPIDQLDSTNIVKALKIRFEISEDYKLGKDRVSEIDDLGYVHERYTQYYKGIKVEDADIRVRYLNGVFHSANGEYINAPYIDLSIALSKGNAIQKAIAYINAEEYMWENEANNNWLSMIADSEKKSFYPDAEIVICENNLDAQDTLFYVAYKVNVFAKEPFRYDYVYVDAKTGKILDVLTSTLGHQNVSKQRKKTLLLGV